MKNAITHCILLLSLLTISTAFGEQQWRWLNPLPHGNVIRGIQYIGARHIWVSSNYGAAYRSTDGGATWRWMELGTGQISPAVAFSDTLNGWIGDYAGNILHTANGGQTWQIQATGLPTNIQAMTFVNGQKGWATAGSAKVLRTSNGGATWDAVSTPALGSGSLYGIVFLDSLRGWVSGTSQTIMNTTDGGMTWNLQPVPPVSPAPAIYDITFVDSLYGWAAGSTGRTWRTTNGGAQWLEVASGLAGVTFRKVGFADRRNGWACGASLGIVHTTNGGVSWTDQSPAGLFNTGWCINVTDTATASIAGDYGLRLKTTNAGATWQQMTPGVFTSLFGITARDSSRIWGVGSVGTSNSLVIYSPDGGATWSTQATPLATSVTLRGVDAIDQNNVWAVGSSGKIIRTTNGGSAWSEQTSGVTSLLYSIDMVDSANGYVSGASGTVLRTTNGGTTWIGGTVGTVTNYFVASPAPGVILVGGAGGNVQKSTNGGSTWTPLSVGTTSNLYGISFLNQDNYWVCGAGGFISRTTNGGSTWGTQATPDTSLLFGIAVQPNGRAIAAGGTLGATVAYTSTNFGTTWVTERTECVVALQAVAFRDPAHALAVGQGGAVQLVRFGVAATPPTISFVSRNVRVPNSLDPVTVTARIVDSSGFGITGDTLLYQINGGAVANVAMSRISGSTNDGVYAGTIPGSAHTNGNRIAYQIKAVSGSGASTTTPVAAANGYFAGIALMSPAYLKAQDSVFASLYKGYYARVSGTVNGPNWQAANLSTYIQDGVGGLNLFKSGGTSAIRNPGDSVTVLGRLDQFRGVTEIVPDSLSDILTIATGRTVPVISLTATQYNNNPELYESRLLKFTSLNRKYTTPAWPPAATAATIIMQQTGPNDTLTMFINAGTNIPGSTEPTYPVSMTCIGTQFAPSGSATQGGYEVLPRSVTDFASDTPPPPGWSVQTSGVMTYLYSVKAVSQLVAWAAGAGGTVLKTINGGTVWTSVGGGRIGTADIYNIEAVDASTAFITTTPGTITYIFRTTNGGTSWDTVYTQPGGFIDAIRMYDANNGIALGDPVSGKWTVAKTTNGGSTWTRSATEPSQANGEGGTQNGLSTVGSTNIWFNGGVGGRIYRSTDGGATWSSGVAPFAATSNVWFTTPQYGVATGSTASQVARSTDGGATWTTVTTSGTGFLIACGGSGTSDFWYAQGNTIYRSTNKGQSWASSHVGVGTYVALSFATVGSSTYGWAVTDSARIAAFNGTVTGVSEQHLTEIPVTFALKQNYPNPFNPGTTIHYELPEAAQINLNIYDVLGRRVLTVTNTMQPAGFYDVVWNGRNESGTQVASGIYFYRLEATAANSGAPFTSMKKMVFLK